MKGIKYLATCFLCILFACQCDLEISDSERIANRMIKDFATTMIDKGLHAAGIGGGLNHATGKHKVFAITFTSEEIFQDVGDVRLLFVETLDAFLAFINNCVALRDALDVFPATIQNINVGIIFSNAQPGDIVVVFNCDERLCYHAECDKPREELWRKIHEETFEEAQALVYRLSDSIETNF